MRARLRGVFIIEYELEPENYQGETDPEKMLEEDILYYSNNPDYFLEDDDAILHVTGEFIDGA